MSLKTSATNVCLKLSPHKKSIFFFLTIIAGICILAPLNNVEAFLAHGDHGRDLYAFKKTAEGSLPYRDYFWIYGPLMPYYYASFLRLFGTSIQSVLLGQNVIVLLSGALIYAICAVYMSPFISFICALWFWCFRWEFVYTYNHDGAVLIILAIILCVFKYLKKSKNVYVYIGSLGLVLLSLIRPNMGLICVVSFFSCLYLIDFFKKNSQLAKKRRSYLYLSFGIISIAALIYWLFLYSLPGYYISQSFPYFSDLKAHNTSLAMRIDSLQHAWGIIVSSCTNTLPGKISGIIILLSALRLIFLIIRNKFERKDKIDIMLIFIVLFIFATLNLHEILLDSIVYRFSWSMPIFIVICFFIFDYGTREFPSSLIRAILFSILLLIAGLYIAQTQRKVTSIKSKENLLHIGPTKIYILNQQKWIQTVEDATHFIRQNVPEGEKILSIPYNAIYYFLSGRDGVVRDIFFAERSSMPPVQQKAIIRKLEETNTRFIILSNWTIFRSGTLGVFGKTHCELLAQHIKDNFQEITTFGDWKKQPEWIKNHAVKILKRIKP